MDVGVWVRSVVHLADRHPGLAGWVQGIGSIVALGIAIGIPLVQDFFRTGSNRTAMIEATDVAIGYADQVIKATASNNWNASISALAALGTLKINEDILISLMTKGLNNRKATGKYNGIVSSYRLFISQFEDVVSAKFHKDQIEDLKYCFNHLIRMNIDLCNELKFEPPSYERVKLQGSQDDEVGMKDHADLSGSLFHRARNLFNYLAD